METQEIDNRLVFGTEENRKMLRLAFGMLMFKIENECEDEDEPFFNAREDKLLREAWEGLSKTNDSREKHKNT